MMKMMRIILDSRNSKKIKVETKMESLILMVVIGPMVAAVMQFLAVGRKGILD